MSEFGRGGTWPPTDGHGCPLCGAYGGGGHGGGCPYAGVRFEYEDGAGDEPEAGSGS